MQDRRNLIGSYRGLRERVDAIPGMLDELFERSGPEAVASASALEAAGAEGPPTDEERAERVRDVAAFEADLAEALRLLDQEDRAADADVMTAPRDPLASLILSRLTAEEQEEWRYGAGRGGGVEVLEAKFDKGDVFGWVSDWFTWVRNRRKFHRIQRPSSAEPRELPAHARVALFSDWGTGLYGAPRITDSIRREADRFDLIMHLGDVYYSGGKEEIRERCLKFWPDEEPGRGRSRSLNANHEMYQGGHGYFGVLLPALGQESSYFALQNEHWALICLDSAWVDHDLDRKQIDWVLEVMRDHVGPGRKTLLFSHHQLLSRLEEQGEKLARALAAKLKAGRFTAWYWGHEHRCFLYDPDPRYGGLRGRCLGHGGIPYTRYDGDEAAVEDTLDADGTRWLRFGAAHSVPGGLMLDGPNPHVPGKEGKYGPHGYMTLELDGPTLTERVHDTEGKVLLEHEIT